MGLGSDIAGFGGEFEGPRPETNDGGCDEGAAYGVVEGIGVGAGDGRT